MTETVAVGSQWVLFKVLEVKILSTQNSIFRGNTLQEMNVK